MRKEELKIHLDSPLMAWLRLEAERRSVSLGEIIRDALRQRAEGIEAPERVCIAKKHWEAQALTRAAVMEAAMRAPDRDLPSPPTSFDDEP